MSYTHPAGMLQHLRTQRDLAVDSVTPEFRNLDVASVFTFLIVKIETEYPNESEGWQDEFPRFFKDLRKQVKATGFAPSAINKAVQFLNYQEEGMQGARLESNPFAAKLQHTLLNRMNELILDDDQRYTWFVLNQMRKIVLENPDNTNRLYSFVLEYLESLQDNSRWDDHKFTDGLREGWKIVDAAMADWKKDRN